MHFVSKGADVPERLLEAQEDGRVVFFCGAGVSYPAGLPDFKGLVDKLYSGLGTTRKPIEDRAYSDKRYDATLDLLERRFPGQRFAVRSELLNILKPKWRNKGATDSHNALITLATDRRGKLRLVTTNFDRIFARVSQKLRPSPPFYAAPLLPIPKATRWDGLVHLHGILPEAAEETALNRLVLTSGDFGLAYLTERWASRFVTDVFRGYTVCFVGYSINDPVLRYMMDALAVDEMLGEVRPEAYAFGGYEPGQYDETHLEWKAKGVTPLLYEAPGHDHAALHMTLREWANTYRDRVRGREMIVAQHATTPPLAPTKADFAVGRMLWALTDELAAKHFADFNPVPPLKWLEPLSEAQFGHGDLTRFRVTPQEKVDDKLAFSFCTRPTPYGLAPWMSLVNAGAQADRWDAVMFHLARWLLRHLGDPRLVLWVARRGAQLHWQFKRLIEARLNDLSKFEANKDPELARIIADAPAAVPSARIRSLWRLMLVGMVKSTLNQRDLWHWGRRFQHEGAIPALRIELRDLLRPCVLLKEPFRLREEDDERVERLVDWDLELASDDVTHALKEVRGLNHWPALLLEMAEDLTALLKDALDIKRALDGADHRHDMSYLHHPSISDDPQNRGYHNWTMLIELTRDAWLEVAARNPTRALRLLDIWWDIPYPTFKRLTFFALANPRSPLGIPRSIDLLLAEDSWWLWSTEVEREAIRLLVGLAPRLAGTDLHRVEEAILVGPPRQMFKDDLGGITWDDIVDREVWLRLAKLREAGAALSDAAEHRLATLRFKHPAWKLAQDQRDEFPFWMGDGDDWKTFSPSPRRKADLLAWLQETPKPRQEDDWRERTSKHFRTAAWALRHLARKDIWPTARWGQALQAWSQDQTLPRSWKLMGPVLAEAPPRVLSELKHEISWWLQALAKVFEGSDEAFIKLCQRMLELDYAADLGDGTDPVGRAINHPTGHVAEALIRWWYRKQPKDAETLFEPLRSMFTEACDLDNPKFKHFRVLLAAHVLALFRVDPKWSGKHLLPLFDWFTSAEAGPAWEGFLWSPRLYRPLMEAMGPYFLETARRYANLHDHAEQYASLLTFASLDRGDTFSVAELAAATAALPDEGLARTAESLARAVGGAGDDKAEFVRNRLRPYIQSIWPHDRARNSPEIAERFARMCIAAGAAFPDALGLVSHWLGPFPHPDFAVHLLYESKLSTQFPSDALAFLDKIVTDVAEWGPHELRQCLEQIAAARPDLVGTPVFQRLDEFARRHG